MFNFYPSTLVRHTVGRKRNSLAKKRAQAFLEDSDLSLVGSMQVALFNESWQSACNLPFYKDWKYRFNLPDFASNLEELREWPILTKADLRERIDLVEKTPGIVGSFRTSGSTGEPFDFPRGEEDIAKNYTNMWSYRSAHGLQPFDPFLAVANTLTGSAGSWWNQRKSSLARSVKDILGNSWRTDGFIPTNETADKALKNLKIMGARYIVGYPSGIASLARRAEEMRLDFPQLTHAILTSETVETTDIKLIERAFQVTALVEYGAIELGAIAGSCNDHGGWPLKVHWWSHLMQLDEADSALISTLEPRIFPLINYAVGDMIVPERVTPGGSVFTIQQVLGRTRDTVTIETRDGEIKTVLARGLSILVRDLPKVTSVQITQRQKGRVELLVVAPGANQKELISKMALAFSRNRKEFRPGSVTVAFIEQHVASARGKRGVFVDKISVPEHFETFSVIPK